MNVAVWHHRDLGPALVAVLPRGSTGTPETARVPYRVPPGPLRRLLAKGEKTTWPDWARHLTRDLPYGGQWAVEEVPDGFSAQQALGHVREQAVERGLNGTSGHEPS